MENNETQIAAAAKAIVIDTIRQYAFFLNGDDAPDGDHELSIGAGFTALYRLTLAAGIHPFLATGALTAAAGAVYGYLTHCHSKTADELFDVELCIDDGQPNALADILRGHAERHLRHARTLSAARR